TDARANILGDEANDFLGDRQLEMIAMRLLSENRNAVFEIGHLDVGDHAPLKARNEAGFQSRNLRRRAIASQDDLASSLVQGVEGVKKLLLHRLFAFEEVHVVDE